MANVELEEISLHPADEIEDEKDSASAECVVPVPGNTTYTQGKGKGKGRISGTGNQKQSPASAESESESVMGKKDKKNQNIAEGPSNLFFKYSPFIAQKCIIIYAVLVVYFCFNENFVFFTWHPLLLTIGWLISMTQGILVVNNGEFLTRNLPRSTRIKCHWILQGTANVLVGVGFLIVVINKNNLNKEHFKSWHGVLGLAAVISSGLSVTMGILAYYNFIPKVTRTFHIFLGIATFGLGGATLILSLYTKWFDRKSNGSQLLFYIGFKVLVLVIVCTLVQPVLNLKDRIYRLYFKK